MPINYIYCIDYDYDTDSSGCSCEGYCRCARISNVRIKSVNIKSMINTFTEDYVEKNNKTFKTTKIIEYCIDRIFVNNEVWKQNVWDINICQGYYGQEVRSINLINESIINEQIEKIISLKNDVKRIEDVLNLEYGYILKDLKNKKYEIETINKSDLIFGQREYKKKIKKCDYYNDEKYQLPRGIVIKMNNKYRLIDGYHRSLSSDSKKIKVIVAKEKD